MLYDLFICHASEDKDSFVRPLVDLLTKNNIEVWYDEFSLKLGDSIRRSIERGLSQSRFGLVVLSKAFFAKNWTQVELDALTEREVGNGEKVILPIWHDVNYEDVSKYSLILASKKAVSSKDGLEKVFKEIFSVVHPQGSPLITARDMAIELGLKTPVITDEYWLEVVEASNRISSFGFAIPEQSIWDRWCFPLPSKEEDGWGSRLAWTALQLNWVKTADEIPISPLTPPEEVLNFIKSHPGLSKVCKMFPSFLAEYAPQLTISGFGEEFEKVFESGYKISCENQKRSRKQNSRNGSGLTINGLSPACDEQWIYRHPSFGDYQPVHVAYGYFHSDLNGPQVSPFNDFDHSIWLLSAKSDWLPKPIHDILITGIKQCSWHWDKIDLSKVDSDSWSTCGSLFESMVEPEKKKSDFKWTGENTNDLFNRVELSKSYLELPESADVLLEKFKNEKFPEEYIKWRLKRE